MKIYSFVSGVIFFISLILVSFPQDLWLILLYWNEPSFAKNLYYFFGNRLFFEDFFYKILNNRNDELHIKRLKFICYCWLNTEK